MEGFVRSSLAWLASIVGKDLVIEQGVRVIREDLEENILQAKCGECGTPDASLQCAKCQTATYCSRKCQQKHWEKHKKECLETAKTVKEVKDQLERLDAFLANYELHQHEPCGLCGERNGSVEDMLQLPCQHIYCIDCIAHTGQEQARFQFTCPSCHQVFDPSLVTYTEWAMDWIIIQSEYYENYDPAIAQSYAEKARIEYRRLENLMNRDFYWKRADTPCLQLYHARLLYLEKRFEESISYREATHGL